MSKATKRERQKENRERAREERERLLKRDRRVKSVRNLLLLLAPIALIAIIISVTSGDGKPQTTVATIKTTEGTIVVALDEKNAPIAAKRFEGLVANKYYDGLCIDRLEADFAIQGGSPECDQKGGTGTALIGETPKDHYPIGSFGAAKTEKDPAGTFDAQFFVVTGPRGAILDNDYARFGNVIEGLDVAQTMATLPVKADSETPAKKITIKSVRISKVDTDTLTSSTSTKAGASNPNSSNPPR